MFLKQNKFLFFLSITVAAFVLYCYNPFQLYFQNDDFIHLQLSKEGILFQRNSFRPVCDLSIMLDYYLWGKNASGYHFINLLLHVITSCLVFSLSKQLLKNFIPSSYEHEISLVTTLLFFAYPFHSEAVFWILGRSAVLGLIFSLLFFIFYLKETVIAKVLSCLFFIIALLTYESSWVLPLYCWLLYIFLDKKKKNAFIQPAILLLLFFIYLFFRYKVTYQIIGNYEGAKFYQLDISNLLINFCKLIARSFIPPFHNYFFLIVFIIISLILFFLFSQLVKNQKRNILTLFIFFLISLVPYISIGIDTHGSEATRFLYFPSAIFCLMISYIIYEAKISFTLRNLFIAFILIFYCCDLYNDAKNYRFAGGIVKTYLEEVNNLNNKQHLYLEQLPQSQNGALILRQGAVESVQLLARPNAVRSIIICSQKDELTRLERNYQIINKKISSADASCGNTNQNDAIFTFTDSALIIRK